MNKFSRANLAALLAIDLRHWAETAAHEGLLQPGTRAELGRIADNVVYDAQLGIVHQEEPPPPHGERVST